VSKTATEVARSGEVFLRAAVKLTPRNLRAVLYAVLRRAGPSMVHGSEVPRLGRQTHVFGSVEPPAGPSTPSGDQNPTLGDLAQGPKAWTCFCNCWTASGPDGP
jgi:hypothetical protein